VSATVAQETACQGCGAPIEQPHYGRRKWCSDRCRKTTLYAVPCERCGERCGGIANGHRGHPSRHCRSCALEVSGEKQQAAFTPFRETMSELWKDGLTTAEIARELGWTEAAVQAAVSRYRAKGYLADFPHRRTAAQVARMKMARWGASA